MSLKYLLAFSVMILLLLMSCGRNVNLPETVDAHYLKYQIRYLETQAGDIPTRILPGHMDTYYTKNYVFSSIVGFFEQFSLIQIADLRRKKVTTLLNFFGNRVYYVGRHGELPAAIIEPDHMNCTYTGETKVIGGLNSEKIKVDTGEEQFHVYATKDFSVRKPNITTPFHSINDPLSEFRVQLSLLKMHLTCTEFESKTIDSEIFTIPEGYHSVSRVEMEDIINSLFTKE
ncbi:MAG: hypothetical protein ABFS38_19885 [Bacteroidota bacterium]